MKNTKRLRMLSIGGLFLAMLCFHANGQLITKDVYDKLGELREQNIRVENEIKEAQEREKERQAEHERRMDELRERKEREEEERR